MSAGERHVVRMRRAGDLAALAEVLGAVHDQRGYPAVMPEDPAAWLAGPRITASWVAAAGDGRPVGHVSSAVAVGDRAESVWAGALRLAPGDLAVVKRLFVDPSREGQGLGRRLLATAVEAAHATGLWPVLDVDAASRRANDLYLRAGWQLVGTLEMCLPGVEAFLANCYVGPAPVPAEATGR